MTIEHPESEVKGKNNILGAFQVSKGLSQGDLLSTILFNLVLQNIIRTNIYFLKNVLQKEQKFSFENFTTVFLSDTNQTLNCDQLIRI